MSAPSPVIASDTLARLAVPGAVREDLARFLSQLVEMYGKDLVSVTAFGSAVSGAYAEGTSDVNLLVVYADLDIEDLEAVAGLAQRWLAKRKFAPRFLSRRNLVASAKYYPVDFLEMRDARAVLYGEDVLASLAFSEADLRWQLAHEVKGMRMRLKQQFWKAAGDDRAVRTILLRRFSSLVRLLRVILLLDHKPTPLSHDDVLDVGLREYGLDGAFAARMKQLRSGTLRVDRRTLVRSFNDLLEMIRAIDAQVDRLVG